MLTTILDKYDELCALTRCADNFDIFRTGLSKEEARAEVGHFAEYWISYTGSRIPRDRVEAALRERRA